MIYIKGSLSSQNRERSYTEWAIDFIPALFVYSVSSHCVTHKIGFLKIENGY